jgi:para-aminobenzoate synthetase component 1
VNRKTAKFAINNYEQFKQQMLSWSNQFNICCLLDNHQYFSGYNSVECLLAAGSVTVFDATAEVIPQLKAFQKNTRDWIFGHVSYDFKNRLEPLHSNHPDHIGFPEIFFFQPETVIQLFQIEVEISTVSDNPEEIYSAILHQQPIFHTSPSVTIQPKIIREEYLRIIHQLKQHIQYGDCYEINFCQEFFSANALINAAMVYQQLTHLSPAPFACYYKLYDKYLMCASPERYIKKTGSHIIAQPIKGTVKRDLTNKSKDALLKLQLKVSEKEISENVMIVDLMRNDLSKICMEGSVYVEELFGIYSFPQVHQMISTITGELKEQVDFADALKATFPMGSMTGAPKRKVMELIEKYEQTKRGLYSGCVGYISPGNDFDFNVVIRSILYNASNHYLSYQVGSGITFNSNAEKEYEECLLKAEAIRKVLM